MKVRALTTLLVLVAIISVSARPEPPSACAVTIPEEADVPPVVRDLPSPGRLWYISADRVLWARAPTTLPPRSDGRAHGLLWIRPADAPLVVTARLTDAAEPAIQGRIRGGPGPYVASEMVFPIAGCWEITATSQDHRLTFIIDVAPAAPPSDRMPR